MLQHRHGVDALLVVICGGQGGDCAGEQGGDRVADGTDGLELARTILVDPATGLPGFNIISAPGKLTEALQKEAFSYPDTITIEKPL